MNSVDKVIITALIVLGITFSIGMIVKGYINSPNEFTIKFEIENQTQEVIKDLNGSIVINNYYGNFTKEITLCKDSLETMTLKENGEVLKTERFENVYNCTLK